MHSIGVARYYCLGNPYVRGNNPTRRRRKEMRQTLTFSETVGNSVLARSIIVSPRRCRPVLGPLQEGHGNFRVAGTFHVFD